MTCATWQECEAEPYRSPACLSDSFLRHATIKKKQQSRSCGELNKARYSLGSSSPTSPAAAASALHTTHTRIPPFSRVYYIRRCVRERLSFSLVLVLGVNTCAGALNGCQGSLYTCSRHCTFFLSCPEVRKNAR